MLLQGKTALITGCNRGIGKAILETFARNGANIYAHARKKTTEFEELCKTLASENNVSILPVYFDLASEEEIKVGVKEISKDKKNIDILVNNAGVVSENKLFQMTKIQEIKDNFEINFFAHLLLTQYISRTMMRFKKGCIINIGSIAGIDGNPAQLEYVASKAAIMGATKKLAIELGDYNIRVNAVAPGLTDTTMIEGMKEDLMQETINKTIMKRVANVSEIANAVLFLASDLSSYITGQILRVDGGMR